MEPLSGGISHGGSSLARAGCMCALCKIITSSIITITMSCDTGAKQLAAGAAAACLEQQIKQPEKRCRNSSDCINEQHLAESRRSSSFEAGPCVAFHTAAPHVCARGQRLGKHQYRFLRIGLSS